MKNTPKNIFLTVQPTFTINVVIHSGRQAEKCGKIEKSSKFHAMGATGDF
jgi:hypothetical protein